MEKIIIPVCILLIVIITGCSTDYERTLAVKMAMKPVEIYSLSAINTEQSFFVIYDSSGNVYYVVSGGPDTSGISVKQKLFNINEEYSKHFR